MTGDSTVTARVDHLVTSGTFSLDGGTWDVDNNVWLVGDDAECIVIDAPHDAAAIQRAIGERRLVAIVCTHAHDDHVNVAPVLADATGAPIWLHPDDRVLWDMTHPGRAPDGPLTDGQEIPVAGTTLVVLHTPGHAPGCVSLDAPQLGAVFSGDTLFSGGPGRDRQVVLRLRHHHGLHPHPAAHAAAPNRRAHRARARHDHRGRGGRR